MAGISDAPHCAVAVFGDQQGAVVRYGYSDRPAPNALIIDDKASHEVVIFPRGHPIVKPEANDLVTCARGPIPRAVQRGKSIALILSRERRDTCARGIERHFQRGRMRL